MTTPVAPLYNTNYDMTMPFSNASYQIALAQNVAESFTLPGDSNFVYSLRFTYISTSNVFVRLGAAPTVPGSGTVGTEAKNEFRPGDDGSQRYAKGGETLYFITPDTSAYVGVRMMQIP